MGRKETYINTINPIQDTPTAHTHWTTQRWVFPRRTATRQGHPLLPLLRNTALGGLTTAIRQEKKKHLNCKVVNVSLFEGNIILHIES